MQKFKDTWTRLHGLRGFVIWPIYKAGNYIYYKMECKILKYLLWYLYRLIDMIVVRTFLNCEFPAQANIGKNLQIPHGGNGVIISINSVIGDNAIIFHQVTIGTNSFKSDKSPVIGNNCFIGCGAKILGDVKIGDNVRIGANAVVINDIPSNSTAVGIPAQVIFREGE
ncbi:serine O-acetyltransferase [Facklamia sp. P12937]|uniref:serine O-acetyltransferase n=1 Tax=Facklamia sp. P12937 TaxID=3421949 RepID=UPI003D170205